MLAAASKCILKPSCRTKRAARRVLLSHSVYIVTISHVKPKIFFVCSERAEGDMSRRSSQKMPYRFHQGICSNPSAHASESTAGAEHPSKYGFRESATRSFFGRSRPFSGRSVANAFARSAAEAPRELGIESPAAQLRFRLPSGISFSSVAERLAFCFGKSEDFCAARSQTDRRRFPDSLSLSLSL